MPGKRKREASIRDPGFRSIEVLEKEPNAKEAMAMMVKLTEHHGVVKVMKEYNWIVPKLIEIHYEGRDANKLGWNLNGGQKIALRLRRPNGFRDFESVLSVLCHELAHNVHMNHSAAFHKLDRELRMKVEQYNSDPSREWLSGRGKKLGGNVNGTRGLSDKELRYKSWMARGGWKLSGSGNRVGGGALQQQGLSQRELLARAVEIRLTEEEELIQSQCGSAVDADPDLDEKVNNQPTPKGRMSPPHREQPPPPGRVLRPAVKPVKKKSSSRAQRENDRKTRMHLRDAQLFDQKSSSSSSSSSRNSNNNNVWHPSARSSASSSHAKREVISLLSSDDEEDQFSPRTRKQPNRYSGGDETDALQRAIALSLVDQ